MNHPLSYILGFILLAGNLLPAQVIQCVQIGNTSGDSSYYDIFQKRENEYWIGGKSGILKKYIPGKFPEDVPYPNIGVSILRINRLGERMVLAADKGTLYFQDPDGEWTVRQIPGYRKYSLYDLLVVDSLTAFVCGGKSKIAVGERTIPFGFILVTRDGGNTWKRVVGSWKSMIWRLHQDSATRQIAALTYSPLGTRVWVSDSLGIKWKPTSVRHPELLHDIAASGCSWKLAGGKSGNLRRTNSCLVESVGSRSKSVPGMPEAGLIWDYAENEHFELATACRGNLLMRDKRKPDEWNCLQLSSGANLYEAVFIGKFEVLIIGSNKSLYRIELSGGPGLSPSANSGLEPE